MKTIGYEIDFPESLDIDTSKDLELARILFEKYGYEIQLYTFNLIIFNISTQST